MKHMVENKDNNDFPSRYVDGKTVYGKSYPNYEFKKLTKSQRQAVIELQRQRKKNNNKEGNDDNSTTTARTMSTEISNLRDDMASLADAIIAGVSRAQGEEVSVMTETPNDNSDDNQTNATPNKRKATAGSVGDFIRASRRRR